MITRCSVFPAYAHSPGLPPPLCAVDPADRVPAPAGRAGIPGGGAVAFGMLPAPAPAGQAGVPAPRGGLIGGAVNFTGTLSTPGGSSGYGYVGMDITDPGSWPRPYNPAPTSAWFCYPQGAR